MNGFERRKRQNKENILKAAEVLFNKYGISKVSVNDIASKAGVSQVTIYNLFGSKDKLIYGCMETIANKFIENLREILKAESKTDKPYPEKLEGIFQYLVEISESNPGFADIEIQNNPELKQLVDRFTEQTRKSLVEFVKVGQKQGHLNSGLSDETVSAYFEIFIKGINASPEVHARIHHNPELFHDLLLLMLYGFSRTG